MSPRFRWLVPLVACVLLGSACAPGLAEGLRAELPPSPRIEIRTPGPDQRPECPPKPVNLSFKFGPNASEADRGIIRDAITKARDYFPLRYPRKARYAYAHDRWECFPRRYTEPVATMSVVPGSGEVAAYWRGEGIRFFIAHPAWQQASEAQRYAWAFHEAYHWAQHLESKDEHGFRTRADPTWLIEGTAEWFGIEAATHFGHFTGITAARAFEQVRSIHGPEDLRRFEGRENLEYTAYPLFFAAVDHLIRKHGGRKAVRAYWDDHRPYPWQAIFRETFGISVARFYREFAGT